MQVTPLRQSDEITVRAWAVDFLREEVRQRATSFGLSWNDDAIAAHIEEHDLDSAVWHDVVHADSGDSELVGILRDNGAPIGLVLATTRLEPYLRVSIGEMKWIYVDPERRRENVAEQLLKFANGWMARQGVSAREARLSGDRSAARQLFEHAGFHVAERRFSAGAPARLD